MFTIFLCHILNNTTTISRINVEVFIAKMIVLSRRLNDARHHLLVIVIVGSKSKCTVHVLVLST